ncbi:MAG TPA: hypothetical protein VHC67_12005 [Gaiellaceae bacterium]|nr:hypothetical protein [Gaiellaceae bacterium]
MQGVVESRTFPVWVAFCTAVTVAVASGVTVDDSVATRIVAGLVGLAAGVVLSFALAALPAFLRRRERAPEQAPEPVTIVQAPAEAPTVVVTDDRRTRLEAQRAAASPDGDVEAWIAATQRTIDQVIPGASGYFASLASRPFADERARLDAHVARLETILRDFL